MVESDSFKVNAWVSKLGPRPWKFRFYFNEIKTLVSHLHVMFHHVVRSANRRCLSK